MKINDALQKAKELLKQNEIDEREARLLLAFSLNVRKEELLCMEEISDEQFEAYIKVIEKRCSKVPYAYIVGHEEFMGLDFIVNENVLIPRDDTETLVIEVIKFVEETFEKNNHISILDLCTGSGCIAISLKKILEEKGYTNIHITASDISELALEVAKENADINNAKIHFIKSDLFNCIGDKFDIIVSNPPYIECDTIDSLQEEVKGNEPKIALDGGKDGLDFYREIINKAKNNFFKQFGYLFFEIGYNQATEVSKLFEENEYEEIKVIKDLSGNDRVVKAEYTTYLT